LCHSDERPQTCGKVESVNRSIQKELIDRVEFRCFLDAKAQISVADRPSRIQGRAGLDYVS